jgi:hypothetical protein
LKEGSDWYKARIHSLCHAIHYLPNKEQHLEEGIQALARHSLNYTEKGPQQLQLLWWEFPEEHWEPLREGCSMNFLISPEGELQMNSMMDEAGKATAGKFVDETGQAWGSSTGKRKVKSELFLVLRRQSLATWGEALHSRL